MWWSEEEWAALVDPAACGMCADAHLDENDHSILIASTTTAHVRLSRNQAHPGYCIVIHAEHVTDMSELDAALLSAFWGDVQRTGRARRCGSAQISVGWNGLSGADQPAVASVGSSGS